MVKPEIKSFISHCSEGNLVPIYKEILADTDTPVSAYLKLREQHSFLLESLEGGEKWARYSFLGIKPHKMVEGVGRTITLRDECGANTFDVDDPIEFLRTLMSGYRLVMPDGLDTELPRFFGGLVGYIGYDMVRFMENLPSRSPAGLDMPDMKLMLTDTMLVFDNLRQTIKVVSCVFLGEGVKPESAYRDAVARIDSIIKRLRAPLATSGGPSPSRTPASTSARSHYESTFGPSAEFEAAVARCKEYIYAGDIFQVVLSQRFQSDSKADPFDVYRALRLINPSPYMYYLDTGGASIVGSSPEILVRLEGEEITLRPIAGTRPRGNSPAQDEALMAELKADPKECAEHIMLVDLGRNDVGRVAEIGTVRVTEMMAVEKYSHVMHMVSNVEGRLQKGLDCFDVLRASFPAGTVTGSPKIRAMEIIEELEPHRRGPYAGCVGYFGYSGNMDTCITIRTIIMKDGKVYIQAGAGIVADSVPENEYAETVNKSMGMRRAVELAEEGEG